MRDDVNQPMNEPSEGRGSAASEAEGSRKELSRKARQGIVGLGSTQAFGQIITMACGIVLARILSPAEFGLFAIATFFVDIVNRFGGIGIFASLIQRKSDLDQDAVSAAFTLQMAITVVGVIILNVFAPWIAKQYEADSAAFEALVRVVSFTLFLTALRSVNQLQLERALKFKAIARIGLLESIVFQVTAVVLAYFGFGIWALATAMFLRISTSTFMMYRLAPWKARINFDFSKAMAIFRYGMPFQANALMNAAGGWITPVVVAPLLGTAAVGYLNFASSNGRKPLILTAIVMRVSFPHFSRLQDDREEVEKLAVKYLSWLLSISLLWFAGMATAGDLAIHLIYSEKWVPAAPALVVFAAALALDSPSWILTKAQEAIGNVRYTMQRILLATILNIAISTALVFQIGMVGVPAGYVIAKLVTLPMLFRGLPKGAMRRVFGAQLWLTVPTAAAIAAGLAVRAGTTDGWLTLVGSAFVTFVVFSAVWYFLAPRSYRATARGGFFSVLKRTGIKTS